MSATLFNQLVPADVLIFDTFEFARFDHTIEVTEHPVEDGQDVADHAQVKSLPITIRGLITETPIGLVPAIAPRATALAWFERNQGKLITVVVPGEGTFPNCMLTRWPHTVDSFKRLWFDVGVKQIRIATPIAVLIAPRLPAPEVAEGIASGQAAGGQATAAAAAPASNTPASVAGTFVGAVTGA